MSEKIIKWGFIGCGEVTKTKSGPAFQKVEHSEVVAVTVRKQKHTPKREVSRDGMTMHKNL